MFCFRKSLVLCCLLALGLVFVLAGCGGGQADPAYDASADRTVEQDFGSYTVPAGWLKIDKYSSEDKFFYVMSGHEEDEQPDNISVEMGTNRYSADEHLQFRDAIVRQLAVQMSGVKGMLTGDGTFTDNGDVLYILTMTEEPAEEGGQGIVTRQYYIVGEKRYVLVHLTIFSGDEAVQQAADKLAKSFVWAAAE